MPEKSGSRQPAACLLQPPRALSRDVTECRSGITARALAALRDAAYGNGVGARSIIVRGMKHDGPPAIVRETHSREVGHGTREPVRHPAAILHSSLFLSSLVLAHSRNTQRRLPSSPSPSPSPLPPVFFLLRPFLGP